MQRLLFEFRWRAAWVLLPCLAPLPNAWRARLGTWLGRGVHLLDVRGRHTVRANLARCFPVLGAGELAALERETFAAWGRAFADLAIVWFASRERVARFVRVRGLERLDALADAPVILVSMHTTGLEAGGIGLSLARPFDYASEPTACTAFEHALTRRRERFGNLRRLSTHATARALVACLERGGRVHVAPDLAFRARPARAIEFCGATAPTLDSLPRLARLTGARVVPCVTRALPGGAGYVVQLGEPWSAYPSGDLDADLRQMNRFFEAEIRAAPAEYRWRHERFAADGAPCAGRIEVPRGDTRDASRGELWGRGATARLRRRDDPSNSATPTHGPAARTVRARAASRAAGRH